MLVSTGQGRWRKKLDAGVNSTHDAGVIAKVPTGCNRTIRFVSHQPGRFATLHEPCMSLEPRMVPAGYLLKQKMIIVYMLVVSVMKLGIS